MYACGIRRISAVLANYYLRCLEEPLVHLDFTLSLAYVVNSVIKSSLRGSKSIVGILNF